MGDLSRNFSAAEFSDKRTGASITMNPTLIINLQKLRDRIGRPIHIRSGYRTAATNKAVGGARKSQHLYGKAADIPPGLATLDDALACGFTGIGLSGKWVTHVDVRPARQPVIWRYD